MALRAACRARSTRSRRARASQKAWANRMPARSGTDSLMPTTWGKPRRLSRWASPLFKASEAALPDSQAESTRHWTPATSLRAVA